MQLFYSEFINDTEKQFAFNKDESRHIVRVLRKKVGEPLQVTNGKGIIFLCEITLANDKNCVVTILEKNKQDLPKYQLHLAVAPTKMNDRFEWFLEKATEIGISEITPLICDHSERKVVKLDRFKKIIQSALKQSLNAYFPVLNEPTSFKEFVTNTNATHKLIAHCEAHKKQSLKHLLKPKTDYLILIGPEGDFSTKEIEFALSKDFKPVSLGETRLRTETAGIVACHSVAFINEL